jgi:hypothetical protein
LYLSIAAVLSVGWYWTNGRYVANGMWHWGDSVDGMFDDKDADWSSDPKEPDGAAPYTGEYVSIQGALRTMHSDPMTELRRPMCE